MKNSFKFLHIFLLLDELAGNALLKIWKAFSAYKNLPDLFDTQTSKKEVNFACLDGIKAISMVWVVIGHSVFNTQRSAVINSLDVESVRPHLVLKIKQNCNCDNYTVEPELMDHHCMVNVRFCG